MRVPHLIPAFLLACTSLSPADAQVYIFSGTLSGLNKSPANASPGTGTATVEFDDATHMMRVTATFSDLVLTGTGTTAAHIHILTPPALTGGVVTQVPSYPGFPLGVTSGDYDATFNMLLASSYNPAFLNNAVNGGNPATAEATLLAGLNAGNAYFNIHSSTFPAGEIRATLLAVPEPATWAMMIFGFGAVGLAMRRRKQMELIFRRTA